MSNREEYIHKMQEKLDEWNSEIDMLVTRVGEASVDAKHEYREQIESLKAKQATARLKIAELQHSGEDAWGDLKTGIELAWNSMGEAVDSARSRFK
ncbi:MAG TPA: hypothetical protein HPP97_13310 [Desulfuromonadales bacterium]|nr:hypothetical protein [Desulfuromonadales bacterium]